MSKIAVVCGSGMGDALILLIASHHLRKMGHSVTTFSRHLPAFGRWLEAGEYLPPPDDWQSLDKFDAVLLHYDNTLRAQEVAALRKSGLPVYIFYPSYSASKHGALQDGFDFPFDESCTMVDNTCEGLKALFGGTVTMMNGMRPPSCLTHRKYENRVLIHPLSACIERTWSKHKYLALAARLKKMTLQPVFILTKEEALSWPEIKAPVFSTLDDLASMIYESGYFIGNESGPGHLASYLSIPHLIIGQLPKRLQMWRPGWHRGEILCPPAWIPNWKGFRLRENKWQCFISTNKALKRFKQMIKY